MGLLTAPIYAIYGYFMRYLRLIITPTVGGVVIMLAVTGLMKDATIIWTGDMNVAWPDAYPRLIVGAITILSMMAASWLGGERLRPWSLLIGLGAGGLASWFFDLIDTSGFNEVKYISFPPEFPTLKIVKLSWAHLSLLLTFAVAAVVTSVSYTANAMVIQEIGGRPKGREDYEAIQGGLYASSVGTFLTGVLGGMPITSSSANLPFLKITGDTSRRVGITGSVIIIVSSFFPILPTSILCLPGAVLGAIAVYLVSQLFATGMAMAASQGLNFRNGQIVGLSLVFGLIVESELFFPHAFPDFLAPIYTNGFAVAGLTAIALSILHNVILERWIVFRVHPSMDNLPEVQNRVTELAHRFNVNDRGVMLLNLACEEAFCHIVEAATMEEKARLITFRLKPEAEAVDVEVSLKVRTEQLREAEEFKPHEATDEELKRLGLFLLGKVARDIGHIHISGHTFLSFRVLVV